MANATKEHDLHEALQYLSLTVHDQQAVSKRYTVDDRSSVASSQTCIPSGTSTPLATMRQVSVDQIADDYLPYSPYYESNFNASVSSFSTTTTQPSSSSSSSVMSDVDLHNTRPNTPSLPSMAQEFQDKPPSENQPEIRDDYGFKRPVQWVSLKELELFDSTYTLVMERQASKWDAFMAAHKGEWPPLSSKLKRYVRRGIPRHLRGKAWMHYSGAKAKMDANPNTYSELLANMDPTENAYTEVIYRDLHRTFPDNTHFSCAVPQGDGSVLMIPDTNSRLQALQRVLLAFSEYSPEIGYCQSLNFLAGFFLMFLESEEEAFWMLVTVIHDYYPSNMFDITMEGATIEQTVLMMMVYDKMPGVWNKISNKRCFWECEQTDSLPPITLVTSHWFLTLFINILPVETVLRVWDCLFVEGYKVMFRVALTLIKMNERRIWKVQDPIEVFQILQNMPRRLIDCHQFMESVFVKTGISADLDMQEIEYKRTMFRNRRRQRIPYRQQLVAALCDPIDHGDDRQDIQEQDCTNFM